MRGAPRALPPIVQQAQQLAEASRFPHSSSRQTGRLLRLLASQFSGGRIGETGSGCGVGAAWIASGQAPNASLITVERELERAAAVQRLFATHPRVRVLAGDWREILAFGPFDMLFIDGGPQVKGTPDGGRSIDTGDVDLVLGALRLGGLLAIDDLGPEEDWPPEWHGRPDPALDYWLNNPRVLATPVIAGFDRSPSSGMLLAARVC